MKSLFNKYEAYNEAGGKFSDEVNKVIDPLIDKWAKKGYCVRDIEAIILDNVEIKSAFVRASRAIKAVRERRKAKDCKRK